jgi:uncharacterized protein (TIGR00369 family)
MTVEMGPIIRAARAANDPTPIVEAIPYARFLGIAAREEEGALLATLAYRDTNLGNPAVPALHGGVVGAFLENTAILQLLWALESVHVPKTITITVDYLRTAGAVDTYARATVTKLGSRVANVRAFAWQGDEAKPVAGANANFLVTPADE